jgi:putative glutamine amidotransferase
VTRRPAVGLCAATEHAQWGPWNEDAVLLPRSYARAVQRAGGLALMLPPDPLAVEHPDEMLDRLDGLVLTGGSDLGAWPDRDRFEIALAQRALERDMPVLGICRGMQLMNVALGGGLVDHLPDVVGHENHRHTPGSFADHHVRLEPGSLAARVVGREQEAVKSHHHQGLDGLGDGLVASGWSVEDGVVEAIEVPERRFALGVLWHPEEDEASRVVNALVEEIR